MLYVVFHLTSELLHILNSTNNLWVKHNVQCIKEKEEREKFGQGFWSALTLTCDKVLHTGIFSPRAIFTLQTVLARLEFAQTQLCLKRDHLKHCNSSLNSPAEHKGK